MARVTPSEKHAAARDARALVAASPDFVQACKDMGLKAYRTARDAFMKMENPFEVVGMEPVYATTSRTPASKRHAYL